MLLATPREWTPGTRYEYNDVNAALVGLVVERATGRRYADYLQEKIWQPMGGASAAVWLDRDDGFAMTACCMLAPAMDWARIGILVKNRGRFGETQIVPADWVDAMTAPNELNPAFGYFTWLAENETLEKSQVVDRDASEEAFLDPNLIMLRGYGGQRVYISRAYDLVIVRLGPFSGYQPLKPGWQDTYLFNGLVRGLRSAE